MSSAILGVTNSCTVTDRITDSRHYAINEGEDLGSRRRGYSGDLGSRGRGYNGDLGYNEALQTRNSANRQCITYW